MKPKEKKPETVYRIIDSKSGMAVGSYSRAYCNEYDFESVPQARTANCHDTFKDKVKYGIAKYRVTYELIEDNCDKPNEEDIKKHEQDKLDQELFRKSPGAWLTESLSKSLKEGLNEILYNNNNNNNNSK